MSVPILVQLSLFSETLALSEEAGKQDTWLNLHDVWLHRDAMPAYVAQSPTITRILDLIGPLDWRHLPERDLKPTLGHAPVPYAAMIAAELINGPSIGPLTE